MSLNLAADPIAAPPSGGNAGSGRSDIERTDAERSDSIPVRVLKAIGRAFGLVWRAVTSPVRFYLSLRRSMTVASVSILLALFMAFNVIWGFPWSGMLGACISLLVVGFLINRVMQPNLGVTVSLPRSAVAGQPFSVDVRLRNRRRFPAMNLRIGWHKEGLREIYRGPSSDHWQASEPVSVDLLRSGDQMQWHGAMRFTRRGVHDLPPFYIESTFPFHLFYSRRSVETQTRIAITPAPVRRDEDLASRILLTAVGEWAKKLITGAPIEYVGNREYQEGVAVRRWDFASWARTGRPIVREYQSPSIQSVTLLVDTALPTVDAAGISRAEFRRRSQELADRFERLMSVAATSIVEISSRRIQLSLVLTCESEGEMHAQAGVAQAGEGFEVLLVRLAGAEPSEPGPSNQRIRETLEECRGQPVMILSLFDLDSDERTELFADLPPNVTYLPVSAARSGPIDGEDRDE